MGYPAIPPAMGCPATSPAMGHPAIPPARFVRVVRILGGFGMHCNSQKRYNIENAVYFITTNTHNRIRYFKESILCDLLVEDLWETQRLKCFNIFAYKINPEHMHALVQPLGKDSYSEIMRSLKTNFSRNANRLMGFDANFEKMIVFRQAGLSSIISPQAGSRDPACNEMSQRTVFNDDAYVSRIAEYRRRFIAKYNFQPPFPKFKWQGSFHDHIIRNRKDFVHHLEYIRRQWLKHKLSENKYCFINRVLYAEAS
jgi:REP element-mobilizing transposase RayT